MADSNFDVVVIGAGPGGYVAAIRAAQLGLSTAIVEKRETLGGTCLNVGCIPSKALLHTSHMYHAAHDEFAAMGIKAPKVDLDLKAMMAYKDSVVGDTIKGVDYLMKKNKITRLLGAGSIPAAGQVTVTGADGKAETIRAGNIIIATGSDVTPLPGVEIDEKQIVSSTGALELPKVPKTMAVIGAGVIGLELGSVWSRLGAEVTVIEFLDHVLPGMDAEISKHMRRILKKQKIGLKLSSKVTGAKKSKTSVTLDVEPVGGGDAEQVKAEVVLVAVGRRPYTDGLGLEELGIELDKGFIPVDAHFQNQGPRRLRHRRCHRRRHAGP